MSALQKVAIRSSLGKSVVFRSKTTGKPCTLQRWKTENTYGGGGQRATRKLRTPPPTLTTPTTIMITDAMTSITLDTTKDYILLLPGAVGNTAQQTPHQPLKAQNNGLVISGGHNVVMIGGAVRRDVDMMAGRYVTSSSLYRAARNRAFFLKDWTGRFHGEGIYIGGQHLYETFNISAKASTASLVLQNICVDAVCLKSPDWTGESSHDGGDAAVQNWDGPPAGMFIDGFSVKATTYQAFFNQPVQFGAAAPVKSEFYNVDIDWARPEATGWPAEGRKIPWPWDTSYFGKGNKMFHFASTGSVADAGNIEFSNFYMNNWPDFGGGTPLWSVNPDPSDAAPAKPNLTGSAITWPGLSNVTGQITVGLPPSGHFVPRETVGIGYVSPGYVDQSGTPAPVTAPTTAAVVTTGTPTSSAVPLSWGAVSGATGYRPQFKLPADSTWVSATSVTGTTATIGSLDPATAYQFRVIAYNSGGDGPASSVVNATTAAAATTPPASGSGENPAGAWTQRYFNDGTSAAGLDLFNPQSGFLLDTTNDRIAVINSGTANSYYGIIQNGTNGPSQANSAKIASLTTNTARASIMLLLNVDNATDAIPLNNYEASLSYVSATKIATFRIRKIAAGGGVTVWSGDVDYSAKSGIEGLIMRFEHRIETDGSHTLELSYDGAVIHTEPNLVAPLTGLYAGIRHYNAGGSSATAASKATIDDIRLYTKPVAV